MPPLTASNAAAAAAPPAEAATTVRRLGPADARAFRALHLEALAIHPEAFAAAHDDEVDVPLAELAARLDQLAVFGAFAPISGAAAAPALAGIATFQRQTLRKRRHTGMIWGMYVSPPHRGGDAAAVLFDAVLAHAAQEVDQVELYVAVGNARALGFYERRGFRRYGVMPRSLRVDGVDHDADMLVKVFR